MENLADKYFNPGLEPLVTALKDIIASKAVFVRSQGKGASYDTLIKDLPDVEPSGINLDTACIRIGRAGDVSPDQKKTITRILLGLSPWRKGPFDLFGIHIDSEWVSSLKWNRVEDRISPLGGRNILDVGCSCGYYMFRMAASDPGIVVGIEPYLTFYYQFLTLQHFAGASNVHCLPITLDALPQVPAFFDTIFCMGILYHRKSPLETLVQLHRNLRKGGQIVLETLIILEDSEKALSPGNRYAKMNNIYFLPSIRCLFNWLSRSGFENIECVDISKTTITEQRRTKWINTESLEDFLDPLDSEKTIEGYPAPVRAMVVANAR
jgi:tRNA (mo5U34)-methyltransferase